MDAEPEFDAFMTALTLEQSKRQATLDSLFRGKMNDVLLCGLQVLNRRRRPEILRAMYQRFRLDVEAARNQTEVEVYSAVELPEDTRGRLAQMLSEKIGKQALLNVHVEPSLLGGLVVQIGDRRLDASLSRQLTTLRDRLMARASEEIHQRKSYFAEAAG